MANKKRGLMIVILLISIIQFVPIDRSVPEIQLENDLITITKPSKEIQDI